jgi:hypothetical protein
MAKRAVEVYLASGAAAAPAEPAAAPDPDP